MKVTLTKSGGLAAGVRRPPRVVDAAALPKPEADELARLVAAAAAEPPAKDDGPGPVRDGMGYTIAVEGGPRPVVLEGADGAMSPAFAALLRWIDRRPKEK